MKPAAFILIPCFLCGCQLPKLAALSDLALTYGQATGRVTPLQADTGRKASQILFTETLPAVDVTATK